MENNTKFIDPLVERATEYGKTSYELIKLKTIDKSASLVSTLISRVAAVLFFSMFVLVFTIGAALWLGELLGKSYYGFFLYCRVLCYHLGCFIFFYAQHN
jgi:hypothetical protein